MRSIFLVALLFVCAAMCREEFAKRDAGNAGGDGGVLTAVTVPTAVKFNIVGHGAGIADSSITIASPANNTFTVNKVGLVVVTLDVPSMSESGAQCAVLPYGGGITYSTLCVYQATGTGSGCVAGTGCSLIPQGTAQITTCIFRPAAIGDTYQIRGIPCQPATVGTLPALSASGVAVTFTQSSSQQKKRQF